MTTAIWWIRRDLRLWDNAALMSAAHRHQSVIPLFIVDERLIKSPYSSRSRQRFLFDGLRSLERDIVKLGGRLIVRTGRPERVLAELAAETDAERVYAERNYSPFAARRDMAVASAMALGLVDGLAALPVGSVVKDNGDPYTVYTPFSRRWKASWRENPRQPVGSIARLNTPASIKSEPIPELSAGSLDLLPRAGESHAQSLLQSFASRGGAIYGYDSGRDRPNQNATSSLSPYLRFGMISAAGAVRAAYEAIANASTEAERSSAETWLGELIWREFFVNIQHLFPAVHQRSFRPEYEGIAWNNDENDFEAWRTGHTGYPFVDAGMRQLAQTGWMHNRLRMVTASFLVKDLLIDWRWGERWFMNCLIDGDPASNNGGWQWVAGTGTDAAPYFRIFNPVIQGQRYDVDGSYIRQWVPELRNIPKDYIHEPWKLSKTEQARYGAGIGEHYPAPIVDHSWARQRTANAYRTARELAAFS